MINELLGYERIIENKDWATVLFVFSLAIIAITRSAFEARFVDFSKLIISDKYNKIYKDSSHLLSWFNIGLVFVQFVSLSFFVQMILAYAGIGSKYDWILFIQIITIISVFVLGKFLIEKIVGVTFDIEELIEQYNLQKVNYRTYVSLCLLPVNMALYYMDNLSNLFIYGLISLVLILNIITYLNSLKNYQKFIIGKLFYFILYLCTLEIAPYYFVYYWYTKT
ncbi:DUF4271 domain-containing protein [Flavobacterium sp.]|uniref:DUF4271 domain-containing protein n=1 Tax=Flavobacterium sp. TaxID=239 RepID=UPI0026180B7F|nr:DUF4271 domain-containing protein [Flavobacterium sp.]MDD3003423.1 DUF4271 domain-containing protein [Flavobacterium sp.]